MTALMLNYARSGGTLLNKCLTSLSNAIVLSEVNQSREFLIEDKKNDIRTIIGQAALWYGIDLHGKDFRENLYEMYNYCMREDKFFIVRDWSYIDFTPSSENNFHPSFEFTTLEIMKDMQPVVFGFVRDAIDLWISAGRRDVDKFFSNYLNYVEKLKSLNISIFRYEDFTNDPDGQFRLICEAIGYPYENVMDKFYLEHRVVGDTGKNSRSHAKTTIKPLPRRIISPLEIKKLNKNLDMKKANELFGYEAEYREEIPLGKGIKEGLKYIAKKNLYGRK